MKEQTKALMLAFKAAGCKMCGEKRLPCLEAHHLDRSTKEHNIATLSSTSKHELLEVELRKCICLCANCHRMIHSVGRRPNGRQSKEEREQDEYYRAVQADPNQDL